MKYGHSRPSSGFTLIELSIVLVIIGLIVGGVLAGQDLITTAAMRAQISQLEKYDTAVNTFKTKYNCLPGDCSSASTQGLGAGTDGNGNEYIESNNVCGAMESEYFWVHLSAAGLIQAAAPFSADMAANNCIPGESTPPLALSGMGVNPGESDFNTTGGVWVIASINRLSTSGTSRYDNNPAHAWYLTSSADSSYAGMYLPLVTYNIDTKIDDGLPMSGKMLAPCAQVPTPNGFVLYNCTTTSGTPNPNACIDDSVTPAIYNVRNQMVASGDLCNALIMATF